MLTPIAMNAYKTAMQTDPAGGMRRLRAASEFTRKMQPQDSKVTFDVGQPRPPEPFGELVGNSLTKVNELQKQKSAMITEFASGEKQNVHELMISMQKAGLAMKMTTTVRNKVMEAYKTISSIHF